MAELLVRSSQTLTATVANSVSGFMFRILSRPTCNCKASDGYFSRVPIKLLACLLYRYRLKCDQNSAVVEVFQYKSSAKSDKPGNPEGPKLRELSVDAFLKTHQRLRKQVSAEVMQERRNGPASHMFASQTTCPDAVMLAELR